MTFDNDLPELSLEEKLALVRRINRVTAIAWTASLLLCFSGPFFQAATKIKGSAAWTIVASAVVMIVHVFLVDRRSRTNFNFSGAMSLSAIMCGGFVPFAIAALISGKTVLFLVALKWGIGAVIFTTILLRNYKKWVLEILGISTSPTPPDYAGGIPTEEDVEKVKVYAAWLRSDTLRRRRRMGTLLILIVPTASSLPILIANDPYHIPYWQSSLVVVPLVAGAAYFVWTRLIPVNSLLLEGADLGDKIADIMDKRRTTMEPE